MAIAGLLAGVAKGALTNTAKGIAIDKAKDFITGKKKKVKPDAIKKKGDGGEAPGDGGGALAVRPQTSMVPAPVSTGAIVPISGAEMASTKGSGDNEEDIINVIRAKVIEIDKVLKGTLAQQKAASKKDRKSDEKLRRKKQEGLLEKVDTGKKDGGIKKLMAPAKGLFGGIFDFLKNILIGRLLVLLLEKKPNLPGGNLLMFIAGMAEKIIDVIIGVIDALGSFLAWGQEKLDGIRASLVSDKGEEAGERFDGILSALTNLFNATIIVGSVFGALGMGPKGPGGKPSKPSKPGKPTAKPQTKPLGKGKPPMKPTGPRGAARAMQIKHGHAARGIYENAIDNGKTPKQAKAAVDKALKKGQIVSKPQTGSLGGTDKGSKVAKGGLKKVPKRLATKVLGKTAIKTIKGIAKGFSKIPIVGPLIVAVSSLLAGEPPAQALFKALGAALGGFLGTFIPIPVVGTLIGEAVGVFVGDLLYTLILGKGPKAAGQKLVKAFKTIMDVGGLALKFFMDGGKRFIENFPTVDVPEIKPASIFADLLSINPLYKAMMNIEVKIPEGGGRHFMIDRLPVPDEWKTALKEGFSIRGILDGLPGLQEILGTFAQFIPGMDKYIENGALKKVPNLLLTTPIGLPFLMPHVAKSFLPGLFSRGEKKPNNTAKSAPISSSEGGGGFFGGLFGSDNQTDNQTTYTGNTGGTEPLVPASVPQTGVAPPISGKGKAIYLHWTAGNYTSTAGPYHTVFTGDGTPHYKAPYTQRVGHTEGRNANAVGLSLAANPETGMFPTEAQLSAMSKEAARIATGWGWSASDINLKNVMTHGEAGSNLDGRVATTNYGRFGRDWAAGSNQPEKQRMAKGRIATFERYDLDVIKWNGINKPATKFGAGGDEMRERIRNMMNVSNSEEQSPDGKMAKGGFIRKQGRYELGEEGPEFILDADSTQPIEKMLPGLLDAINTAKGEDAVGILRSYADYEEPARDELVMAGGSTGGSSYGETQSSMPDIQIPSTSGKGSSDWKDIRYKFG